MRITILAVGGKMPDWVTTGYENYSKRLPREFQLHLKEIPLAVRSKNSDIVKAKEKEGRSILDAIPKGDKVIALEVTGRSYSTEKLASLVSEWQMEGDNISLLIGGPDGLSQACLQAADLKWSFSDLTLPHPLVRIVLVEQLYRAWTIIANHPYHK